MVTSLKDIGSMFRQYQNSDYNLIYNFLIEINKDKSHLNWQWGRFEWMMEHPLFDKANASKIGLWLEEDKLVGLAIFDMYFGEVSCLTLKGYEHLYQEILTYAYEELKDDNGLGVAINKNDQLSIKISLSLGFNKYEQKEVMMEFDLSKLEKVNLPHGYHFEEFNEEKDVEAVQWVFYQGFGHGNDYNEFLKTLAKIEKRPHFNSFLASFVSNEEEKVAYCSLWYDLSTDYAYLEPLCVIPGARNQGIAKALVYELLGRVKSLGAKYVYVLSDMEFYEKLGFKKVQEYNFYWKK